MAYEEFLVLYNTAENKLLNRAYKDTVFAVKFSDPDLLATLEDVGLDPQTLKFELSVKIDGTTRAVLKAPLNKDFVGALFHIEQVIQDYTQTDSQGYAVNFGSFLMPQSEHQAISYNKEPHSIHTIDKFANNRDNLVRVHFELGMSYYNEDGSFAPAKPKPINGTKNLLSRYYFWNAVQQHDSTNPYQGVLDTTDYIHYILDGNTKRFLTNQDNDFKRKVRLEDYHTLGFFNGKFCESANQGHGHNSSPCVFSNVKYIYCRIFSENGNTIAIGYVENNANNGGAYYPILESNTVNIAAGEDQFKVEDKGLLYVGVGPQNIIDNYINTGGGFIDATDFASAHRYEIWASGPAGQNDVHSLKYDFEIQENDCKGYETIRLAYLNRQGCWDYMNFTKKSTRTTDITRSNFKQNYGITPLQGSKGGVNTNELWKYDTAMGGTKTYNVNAIETIEANSDWLTEEDAIYLEELFTSPDTYMQFGDKYIPVVVTEKDYTKQTKANDKLIQYVISIQKGHETRIQRI